MSIPPDSPWRGAAAHFSQPVNATDVLAAQHLSEYVYHYNCRSPPQGIPPLPDIEYRTSSRESDVLRHVFRWDAAPYEHVFVNGFEARREDGVPEDRYFNLELYVNYGGRPLDSQRTTTHAFISTTMYSGWHPSVPEGEEREVYRYEIYAPGGILISETLGDRYRYPAQDEVCFIAGIAPQYIRSAQSFRLSCPSGSRFTRRERVDTAIIINAYFNPQSHPERPMLINRPVVDYLDRENRLRLRFRLYPPTNQREKRAAGTSQDLTDYYTYGVADEDTYIDAAFRSSRKNEAYIFFKKEYVLLNYAPGTKDDYVVEGPRFIYNGFRSLACTPFAAYGIDCAFGCPGSNDEAFIFSGKLCAKIHYGTGGTNDWIIEGPMTIAKMFPFFRNSREGFHEGVDAAFESTVKNEAYIFKGKYYALINYATRSLIATRPITEGFRCLANTMFESGIDAAFASHRSNEAYLFKGKYYALIYFTPATTGDYIIGGPKEILPDWPSLRNILPRKNRGLDIYEQPEPEYERDHDEL